MSFGLFLDVGNTFGWFVAEDVNKIDIKWSDYFTKLAMGTGIGLRYETPIGPIRVDFATPIYDPMKKRSPFSKLVFVFGIGHAF